MTALQDSNHHDDQNHEEKQMNEASDDGNGIKSCVADKQETDYVPGDISRLNKNASGMVPCLLGAT